MKLKPTLVAVLTTAAVGGATLVGASAVHAQSSSSGSTLVDRIAARFNLQPEEVQSVFDEVKAERKTEMKLNMSDRLQAKVDDGTITAEQKTAIEAKLEEMHQKRQSFKDQDLTHEEMRTQMEQARTELETWATEQGITLSDILPVMKHGGHHMRGGAGMRDVSPDDWSDDMPRDSDNQSQSDSSGTNAN